MHGLLNIDGVWYLYAVRFIDDLACFIFHWLSVLAQLWYTTLEYLTELHQNGTFGERFVKTYL